MRPVDQRSNVLSTRIPGSLRASLERIAHKRHVPLSTIVREALERFSATQPPPGARTAPSKRNLKRS
jgi:predicted transcriptional regulator